MTKFFPDFLFPDQYFSLIFFHLTKNLSRFFSIIINIIISYLFAKFIITIFIITSFFFWCTLFIVIEQSSFNKNFEMRVKVKLKLKVKLVGEKWRIWKISRGKVTNFSEVSKSFPDENVPRIFFSRIRYVFSRYILIIYRKFFAFQFLIRGRRMYLPILTGVKNELFTR